MGRPAMPTPEKWCDWCGQTLTRRHRASGRIETRKQFEARKYCNPKCFGEGIRVSAKEKNFGMEYEPKPAWTECEFCGARRPPASLKEGQCSDWDRCQKAREADIRAQKREADERAAKRMTDQEMEELP